MAVEARSAKAFGRHTHDEFGFGVVLGGAQDSASGRGPVRAVRGQVITVNPGEVHDGVPIGDASRHWRMLYIRPEAMAAVFSGLDLPAGSELVHPVLDRPATARAFIDLHAALTSNVANDLALESLLVETVGDLMDLRNPRAEVRAEAIAPARQTIDADPSTEMSLKMLADMCQLSQFHFLRTFRTTTGLPPHAYRVQRRLHQARQMISSGHPLADVAAACGFSDQAHLHRHFVRSLGYTPGALARS